MYIFFLENGQVKILNILNIIPNIIENNNIIIKGKKMGTSSTLKIENIIINIGFIPIINIQQ